MYNEIEKYDYNLADLQSFCYSFFTMYEVRVTADFAAAHFLKDYNGKCENLHGHNYTVYAHVEGEKLNEGGMLLDFTKLKGSLREICKTLDHTNLNDMPIFAQNPSAERIAMYIYNGIIDFLKFHGVDLLKMFCVLVFRDDPGRDRFGRLPSGHHQAD